MAEMGAWRVPVTSFYLLCVCVCVCARSGPNPIRDSCCVSKLVFRLCGFGRLFREEDTGGEGTGADRRPWNGAMMVGWWWWFFSGVGNERRGVWGIRGEGGDLYKLAWKWSISDCWGRGRRREGWRKGGEMFDISVNVLYGDVFRHCPYKKPVLDVYACICG